MQHGAAGRLLFAGGPLPDSRADRGGAQSHPRGVGGRETARFVHAINADRRSIFAVGLVPLREDADEVIRGVRFPSCDFWNRTIEIVPHEDKSGTEGNLMIRLPIYMDNQAT